MDDNVKDDFENITSSPKPDQVPSQVPVKKKNPGRVEAGKRLAERNKENKLSNNNYLYIGIGVATVILILLKKTSSTPTITPPTPCKEPPPFIQPSESQVVASERFDDDMFNL